MGEYVLVVEDDTAMAEGIRDVLELAGYEVQLGHNGTEALMRVAERVPDLIVSDIMMPEMDGYKLLERIRDNQEWVSIPFIFLTSKSEKQDIRRGFDMGAEDYLPKPFEWADLKSTVRARLARARQLEDASRSELYDLKNRILNTLSHEFRTPLTYITGYAELIQDENLTSEQLSRFLQGLQNGGTRLGRLVEDFLFLVSLETEDATTAYFLQREDFSDWCGLLARVMELHSESAAAAQVTLEYEVEDNLSDMLLQLVNLEDAISRLVGNAIKFSLNGPGRIKVHVSAKDEGVLIEVSDEGIGIPSSELPYLFEAFHQVDRDTYEQQGAGVGLAIVKGIVTLHGGQIDVKSEVGKGSTFAITLPKAEEL